MQGEVFIESDVFEELGDGTNETRANLKLKDDFITKAEDKRVRLVPHEKI